MVNFLRLHSWNKSCFGKAFGKITSQTIKWQEYTCLFFFSCYSLFSVFLAPLLFFSFMFLLSLILARPASGSALPKAASASPKVRCPSAPQPRSRARPGASTLRYLQACTARTEEGSGCSSGSAPLPHLHLLCFVRSNRRKLIFFWLPWRGAEPFDPVLLVGDAEELLEPSGAKPFGLVWLVGRQS